jgi:carbon storage regulator
MLVLSRHINESVIVGDHVVVTVLGVRGDKVRIGFEAPIDIRIDRLEVRERIMRDAVRDGEGGAA